MSNGVKTILELENVTMQFGGVVAVDSLSMHVDKGEIVALIGPNGAAIKHKHNKHKKEPGITPRLFRVPSLPACG